jgi:flagellar hook protein FlgE
LDQLELSAMGAFDALATAVSGLQAQSFALQNISGNVANAQTTGFKAINTNFQDLLDADPPTLQSPGGAQALSAPTNTVQGSIQTASVGTFMAIDGDGYFAVKQPSGTDSSGQPLFADTSPVYTRRGDFQLDGNGFLVNGAGYYLMGSPIDQSTGTAGAPQVLQFDSASLPTDQGTLQSLSMGSNGRLQGSFSSGKVLDLATIPLSAFNGDDFLQRGDGETFTPTQMSGTAQANASGKIVGNALEASNTDVAGQFTTMIMTQQAYTANTKVVTTTDQMLQTVTNMTV